MYREGMVLTLLMGEIFVIIQHHKKALFHDVPVFPLSPPRKTVAVIKALFAFYLHLYSFM